MASGSGSSTQLTPKSSRFSTSLKVFKFVSKEKEAKPPPLPPKDEYYLRNRSLASLSPESLSIPNTPVTPGFQQSRGLFPDMNKSAVSLISTAPSSKSTSRVEGSSSKGLKKEKSGFFRFPKRQKSQTKSPTSEAVPPLPTDHDEGISMPWNFQHNIHVDEGFIGMPPSWLTSLTAAGFSPEEIENIQHRRTAARSPTSQYANSIRPLSPPSDAPMLANPVPRTTSLPRQQSKSSLTSSENIHASRLLPQRQLSAEQGTSFLDTDPMESRIPVIDISSAQRSPSRSDSIRSVGSLKPPSRPVPPVPGGSSSTSPQRSTHDTDSRMERQNSQSRRAPPVITGVATQKAQSNGFISKPSIPTPESSYEGSAADLNGSSSPSLSRSPSSRDQNRLTVTASPPRLSLPKHEDSSDLLSSWGEALLSGISSGSEATPNTSTFANAQESKLSATKQNSRDGSSSGTNQAYYERMQSQVDQKKPSQPSRTSPLPPLPGVKQLTLDFDDDDDPLGSSRVEPASTARFDPDATSWDDDEPSRPTSEVPSPPPTGTSPLFNTLRKVIQPNGLEPPMSAALSESSSLTIPITPNQGRKAVPPTHKDEDEDGEDLPEDESLLKAGGGRTNRDSSRSSTSTVIAEPATIVRSVSIIRRAAPVMLSSPKTEQPTRRVPPEIQVHDASRHPPSPLSSNFGSEGGSTSGTGSSSPTSYEQQTPMTDGGLESPLTYYYDSTPSPDPAKLIFPPSPAYSEKSGRPRIQIPIDDLLEEEEYLDDDKPRIVINDTPSTGLPTPIPSGTTPKTPFQRYPGWLSSVVEPLEEFIDEAVDPRNHYLDLHEIAEGESGSVFAARLAPDNRHKLKLAAPVMARDQNDLANGTTTLVAIKSVVILPTGSPKLTDLQRELSLMKGLAHDHILSMDAVYVDLVEDSLWIRMELMERSLADVIALVPHGLMLQQDRLFARFASDVLLALDFLQQHRIAHRDVRSDNLLLNSQGLLKLADFSTAVHVPVDKPRCSDVVGVVYWQAPEMRSPPYDALQVDVWSLGATVWEMAEAEPPFAETQQILDHWPPLQQPELYSPGFHDFLRQCSLPPSSRPKPKELRKSAFINNACGRAVVIQILSQCMAIEQHLQVADGAS